MVDQRVGAPWPATSYLSDFPKPLLHLVQHVVDQAAGPRLRAAEAQEPASGGWLARDRQALGQAQVAAGAVGLGVGRLTQHIQKDGAEGCPLALTRLAHQGLEGGGQKVLMPGRQGGGDQVKLAGGKLGGGGGMGPKILNHPNMGADPGAGGAGGG